MSNFPAPGGQSDLVNAMKGQALNTGALVKAFDNLSTSINNVVGGTSVLKGFSGSLTFSMAGGATTYVLSDSRILAASSKLFLQPLTPHAFNIFPFLIITKVDGSITVAYPNNVNTDCVFDYVVFIL